MIKKSHFEFMSALFFLMSSCASTDIHEHSVSKLIPQTLRVRRPAGPGANPKASPGGPDYRSDPLPDAQYDCKSPSTLVEKIDLMRVRDCIASLSTKKSAEAQLLEVVYKLKRDPVPHLELQDKEEAPPCMVATLPLIPVPREIFFQGESLGDDTPETRRVDCFASRLDIEADEWLGFKLPISKLGLRITFPPQNFDRAPDNVDEMRRLLVTWALTPFWDTEKSAFRAKLVPDNICRKCLTERGMKKGTEPDLEVWP